MFLRDKCLRTLYEAYSFALSDIHRITLDFGASVANPAYCIFCFIS